MIIEQSDLIDVTKDDSKGRYYNFIYQGKEYKFISVTTVLGKMMSKPALVPWAYNMGIEETAGWVQREAESAISTDSVEQFALSMSMLPYPVVKEALKQEERSATDRSKAAQERGTRIHTLLERMIDGTLDKTDMSPDSEAYKYLEQLERFCEDYQPEWHESEQIVVNFQEEYAGTLDAICTIHNHPPRKRHESLVGKKVVLDLKTGKDAKVYPESHFPQLCAYGATRELMGHPHDAEAILAISTDNYSVGVNYYPYFVFTHLKMAYDSMELAAKMNPNARKKP